MLHIPFIQTVGSFIKTCQFITHHPLTRKQWARAISQFIHWQVGIRVISSPVVYTWLHGTRVIVYSDDTGFTGNIYCGLHEFQEMAYILHVISDDDVFVDVGANVGAYTLLACSVKGARGFCFEPVPTTFARLMDNLRLNSLTERVRALPLGIADTISEVAFSTQENCMNHVLTDNEQRKDKMKIQVMPLDAVLADATPSMLKIDVEGFETAVIMGAEKTLQNQKLHSVILELHGHGARYGFDEEVLLTKMQDEFGFAVYTYEPITRNLQELDGKPDFSGNVLFVRNIEEVKAKIASAPPVTVGNITL